MITYKNLLHTRSDHLVTLLKFILGVNGINFTVENEHVYYYNPRKDMSIKVEEEKLQRAKGIIEELPRRLETVEVR